MGKVFFLLMAMFCVACEDNSNIIINKNVRLSDVSIECINETIVSDSTSNSQPYTKHTYLCKGVIGGFRGICYIRIVHDNIKVCNDQELIVADEEIPFEFVFAPEQQHLDNPNNNFMINVYDNDSTLLCKTTVVVTKHAEKIPEESTEQPYAEYSLSGSSCEWNFAKEDGDIIVVNSFEELGKYIVCEGECTPPSIDFEKHSLVIAHGGCTNGIHQVGVTKFVKLTDTKYGLYIDIVVGWTDAPELWTYAIITDKINEQNIVELFVNIESI